jgi:predicted AlkP superfamily pyrophosphatase or phosphodiesterase
MPIPSTLRRSSLAGLFASVAACASAQPATSSPQPSGPPKLVVMIVVDQLRGDMLERYRADLSKGYARLMTGGAWFTNGFQDHAITETAPGHASTMSGRFPAHTGIITNTMGVADRAYPLLVGRETGASPDRFNGTTLTDWLTAKDPRTRAFSVSRKDRGAILPIGKSRQQVYWYSPSTGAFTTSKYYRDSLPAWVVAFNDRRIPQSYAGKEWALSRPASSYSEPDSVPNESNGRDITFPHLFPLDSAGAARIIISTPSMDSIEALFALEGLNQLGIGKGPQTDVMSVSFSTTDAVGHAYGPDSREAHENEIRLDQTIGWFLDSLFKLRDPNTVVIALTGDHGSSPIPELARARGEATGNQGLRVSLRPVLDSVIRYIASKGGDTTALAYDGETFAIEPGVMAARGIKPDDVLDLFKQLALRVPGVARVDRMDALRKADPNKDPIARRWTHQIPEDYPVDLVITLTRYSYWSASAVSTHGSPYDQDASVPIIFYGPWVKPGRYTTFARTVDIGVTLGAIAGVKPTEKVDGVVLRSALK